MIFAYHKRKIALSLAAKTSLVFLGTTMANMVGGGRRLPLLENVRPCSNSTYPTAYHVRAMVGGCASMKEESFS